MLRHQWFIVKQRAKVTGTIVTGSLTFQSIVMLLVDFAVDNEAGKNKSLGRPFLPTRRLYRLQPDNVVSLGDIFIYLLENWTDLDETWHRNGEW